MMEMERRELEVNLLSPHSVSLLSYPPLAPNTHTSTHKLEVKHIDLLVERNHFLK